MLRRPLTGIRHEHGESFPPPPTLPHHSQERMGGGEPQRFDSPPPAREARGGEGSGVGGSCDEARSGLFGPVARRMAAAVAPYSETMFITPMAAVAGSVADDVLAAMVAAAGDALARAYVNNGGDIALHLSPGTRFTTGLVDRPDRPSMFGTAAIEAGDPVRGIATSGAGGRSFSLGIADAVTILARDAASADAAATVVANAVNISHPGILRVKARELQPDSDLGDRLVTRVVPALARPEIDAALDAGVLVAEQLLRDGLIAAAALHLQGVTRAVGALGAGSLGAGSLGAHASSWPGSSRPSTSFSATESGWWMPGTQPGMTKPEA
ncbi:hypothetical protein CH341_21095 [Rhodoplanes roseus]|uniref:Uncharacterized protein n=2 Tax=Rhodoplanes roseus TaxID=29409 RepID=A0A327KUF5_9BRAD|nr:hypothetical protein CH341_21095 [Rhodoplanes roseus]